MGLSAFSVVLIAPLEDDGCIAVAQHAVIAVGLDRSRGHDASSGAGTQPSGIHVVTDQHFINWYLLGWTPLPSNGNAIVFSSSNPSAGGEAMTGLTDNYGDTYTRTAYTDPTVDPQQFSACLGSNVSARDRIFSYTPDVVQTHVEIYTIAGADNRTA